MGSGSAKPTPGLLWVQTDDGAYTDTSNCMMLAALPGSVGDGEAKMVTNKAVPLNGDSDQMVQTYAGKSASPTVCAPFSGGGHGTAKSPALPNPPMAKPFS